MRAALLVPLLALALLVPPALALVADYQVGGAHGLAGSPEGAPKGFVLILHGYGHQAESHRAHLEHLAAQGWAGVAMDYTGPQAGFPLGAGAADSLAALRDLRAAHGLDDEPTVLYSVSMGTAVAALVLPQLTPEDRTTYWVNNEGLASLAETWAEAKAVSPGIPFGAVASAAIESECGGTPAQAPDCYRARSAALRAAEFPIQGAVLTHGLNDGLVPYNQGREMAGALRANGIPTEFWTVATCAPGSEGTTITGHATLGGRGVCGHGTESNDAHTLTALSFGLLDQVLEGSLVPADREHVVDGTLGTLP
jgi:hypothetical protein